VKNSIANYEDDDEIIKEKCEQNLINTRNIIVLCYHLLLFFFFYPRYKLQCEEFHYKRLYGVYATTMVAIMVINYIPPLKNICSLLLVILGMWLKQHPVVVNAWSL
jgi:hypothetical protein